MTHYGDKSLRVELDRAHVLEDITITPITKQFYSFPVEEEVYEFVLHAAKIILSETPSLLASDLEVGLINAGVFGNKPMVTLLLEYGLEIKPYSHILQSEVKIGTW